MKRLLVCVFVMLALTAAVAAQQQAPLYTVQPGDNLWNLAGQKLDDPTVWQQIMENNPFLKDEGRIIRKSADDVVVIIRPGVDKLAGLEKLGIIATPVQTPAPAPAVVPSSAEVSAGFPWWLYLLLALLVLAVMAYLWLRRDPVTAGPPMVPGGVNDGTAGEHLMGLAGRRYPGQSFTIVRTERGRLNGLVTVRYSDGSERQLLLQDELGYRALVRFPNGNEETLYMLQGCGNDLRYSGISRYIPLAGFSFTPDQEVPATAPAVVQEPAPASVPQARTEPAALSLGAAAAPVHRSLFFTPSDGDRPNMLKATGMEWVKYEQNGGEIILRFS